MHNFMPDMDHKDLARLSHEQIVNSYDNTILATDEFLSDVIDMVRHRNAIVFYISDHGEGLGEKGVYMHASDVEPLHYPACLFWTSGKYEKLFPNKVKALRENRLRHEMTDAVFHTVLDAGALSTTEL